LYLYTAIPFFTNIFIQGKELFHNIFVQITQLLARDLVVIALIRRYALWEGNDFVLVRF